MRSRFVVGLLWVWASWSVVSTAEYLSGGTPSLAGLALGVCIAGLLTYGRAAITPGPRVLTRARTVDARHGQRPG